VYLGDLLLGTTPLNAEVAPGDYQDVQVVLDGMVPVTLGVTVREGKTAAVAAGQLHEMVTALQFTTDPGRLGLHHLGNGWSDPQWARRRRRIFDLPVADTRSPLSGPAGPTSRRRSGLPGEDARSISHDFPEGTVAITSEPNWRRDLSGNELARHRPSDGDIAAGLRGTDGEDDRNAVAEALGGGAGRGGDSSGIQYKSDGLSATGYHHRRPKKQPPSTLARFGDSIKLFFFRRSRFRNVKVAAEIIHCPRRRLAADPVAIIPLF